MNYLKLQHHARYSLPKMAVFHCTIYIDPLNTDSTDNSAPLKVVFEKLTSDFHTVISTFDRECINTAVKDDVYV